MSAVLRLNPLEFFARIMLPAAAPYIFTGLRIGVGLSWLAIVAAEMLTGGMGIGFFIWDAWNPRACRTSSWPSSISALSFHPRSHRRLHWAARHPRRLGVLKGEQPCRIPS